MVGQLPGLKRYSLLIVVLLIKILVYSLRLNWQILHGSATLNLLL